MAYSIRALADLGTQARGFFTLALPGAVASVWANTFTVLGKVLALLDFEHEQRRAWLVRQQFASTADEAWLARHGFELGLTRDPATVAVGSVAIGSVAGLVVPAGLTLTRQDGLTYTTIAGATATGPTVTLEVEADGAGRAGNTDAGATLALDTAIQIPGLTGPATVLAPGLTGGADAETIETFRARILQRKRNTPQGGAASDYDLWTREALPSVAEVYVDTFANDVRSVWVAFTVTDTADGIPTSGQVATVQAYLSDTVRRPVTARVYAVAPVAVPVAITIRNLSPDNPDTRASVAAELAATFADLATPATPNALAVLYRSWIQEAISRAVGESHHDLVLPAGDLTFTVGGQLPVYSLPSYTSV